MKTINISNQSEINKFKSDITGWLTSSGFPYHLDDLTPEGGNYTIYCPAKWKNLYSAQELKSELKQDVDAQQIIIEYINFIKD